MYFFDHNATTPLSPAAREAWLQAGDVHWLNPSSPYRAAAAVKVRLDAVRAELSAYLGVEPGRLVFNSGATEGNNAVLRHWKAVLPEDARIGISPIEHPSILEPAKRLFGDRIEWLPLGENGRVCLDGLDLSGLAAVSMMAANNETGCLQPWHRMAELCRAQGIPYHCDASQWIGKLAPRGLADCNFFTGCAHKFCGPRGVGFLVVPESLTLEGGLLGGRQQAGLRAGTEDLAGAAAMMAALQDVDRKRPDCGPEGKSVFWERLRDRLPATVPVSGLDAGAFHLGVSGKSSAFRRSTAAPKRAKPTSLCELRGSRALTLTGHVSHARPDEMPLGLDESLWNTVALILPEFSSARWIRALEKKGFFISAGSACSTGHSGPSHVLAAMGLSPTAASRVIRISSGWETSVDDWKKLAEAILEVYRDLSREDPKSKTRVISI